MKRYFLLVLPLCAAIPAHSQAKTEPKSELPLRQVVLFSSGVGYFSRSGLVEDNAVVDLNVRAPQISDLLKSLVLFDEKGTVAPVSYSIQDFLGTRTTETDLQISPSATPGTILRTFRGANVVLTRKAGDTIEGRIVSVSSKSVASKEGNYEVEVVSLMTLIGLQTVDLSEVSSFQLTDPALQLKLRNALEKSANALTSKLDDGVRSVKLRFNGKGKRNARAGYLLEMPTWKTSYRLVLDDEKKPYLQGWAVVENPTDADWKDVGLSLVAGRPISFIQNMAAPIYITRPVIDSQIPNASFEPQTFGDSLGKSADQYQVPVTGKYSRVENRAAAAPEASKRATGIFSNSGSYDSRAFEIQKDDIDKILAVDPQNALFVQGGESVQAQANGKDAGDLFVYAIDAKLTLPRGEAAMVPIVSQNVDGESVTIIPANGSSSGQKLVPQNGFCLRNDSKLHLQGGPITVYSGGIYGGDALIQNVSPGESKLIAYGLDLDLVSKREDDVNSAQLLTVKVADSQIVRENREYYTQKYALKNKIDKAKSIIIQQNSLSGWNLVDPKQRTEKAIDGDRFRVELKPNEARDYEIKWVRTTQQSVAIGDFDFWNLDLYLKQNQIAPELKAKLDIVAQKKAKVNNLKTQIAAQNATLKSISDDQTRLRENMRVLDRTSKLYQTYESKLGAQEERIAKIDAEIDRLQAAQKAAETEFDTAIKSVQ